jgi:hypothetical protein
MDELNFKSFAGYEERFKTYTEAHEKNLRPFFNYVVERFLSDEQIFVDNPLFETITSAIFVGFVAGMSYVHENIPSESLSPHPG